MNDLFVEVQLDDDVRYKALIEDFTEDAIDVSFESSELAPRKVNYEQVFTLPPPVTVDATTFKPGDECEVQCQVDKDGPVGWRPVVIKMVRGEFYMFNYKSANLAPDVMQAENFRPKNTKPHLEPDSIFKFTATVQPQVAEIASEMSNHAELKKHLSPAKVSFDVDAKEVIVVTTSSSTLATAKMLMDLHIKFLEQKANIIRRTKLAQQQLEGYSQPRDVRRELNAKHVEEFPIKEHLMGLAIGSNGHNIIQARHATGVLHVDVDENRVFRIYADSEKAALEARRILEFDERVVRIPRNKIARVIGRNGTSIQEMVDRSGVVRVKVEGDQERNDEEKDYVPILLTGTVESIENMSAMIDYYLMHIEDIDNLIASSTRPKETNEHPQAAQQQPQQQQAAHQQQLHS